MQGQMEGGTGGECRCSQSLPMYRKCLLEDTGRLGGGRWRSDIRKGTQGTTSGLGMGLTGGKLA